jgi:splicing factor U2AF subunit
LLLTLNPESNKNTNPIVSIEKCDEGYYYIFELSTKDDIEILMNMDQTDWRGYRIRIQKPRRFFTDYNDTQGSNAKKRENKKQSLAMESDNKLYMGGIPLNAKESEVRELVESFGQLKLFNLVKDPNNDELNRGFCFFEYLDEKVTERALKGLNNIDMGERKLRVQRATINNKSFQILQQMKANPIPTFTEKGKSNFSDHNPTIQPHMHVEVPIYAALPSRVIQLINMINAEDVMDDLEYREIVEDIRNECMQYGTVLNVEIPRPDKLSSIAGPAVGKIFIKFSTLQAAKKARFKICGKKYNRRTVVSSFYPENYFDVREFNFHER